MISRIGCCHLHVKEPSPPLSLSLYMAILYLRDLQNCSVVDVIPLPLLMSVNTLGVDAERAALNRSASNQQPRLSRKTRAELEGIVKKF